MQAALDDFKQGKIVTGPKQTVEQYLTRWLESEHRLKVEPQTLQVDRSIFRVHLIPELGHLRLDQVSREQIQTFCTELFDDGLSPGYIKRIYILLSSALQEAVENGILARNPCHRVTLPRVEKYQARFLTLEESKRLVAAAKGHRLWLFLLVMLTTGARRGEVTGLRWSDINVNKGEMYIGRTVVRINGVGLVASDPKTLSSTRTVGLAQPVLEGLREQKGYIQELCARAGVRWKECGLVFPNRYGEYIDRIAIQRQFQRILGEAGLPYMRFHDLRHSAATLLLASGVHIKVVQEMLGHANVQTTLNMYGHVLPNMQQTAIDKLNDMFGQ